MFVRNADGEAVQLLAQDARGVVTFKAGKGPKAELPSHEFFTDYRPATSRELAKFAEENPPPPGPVDKLRAQVSDLQEKLKAANVDLGEARAACRAADKALGEARAEVDALKKAGGRQ